MSAESYNSDDERYADDTFEQGSDTDVPEVPEIESEISEVSDAEDEQRLLTVKLNTAPVRRNYHNIRPLPANTDSVPFDSSSDEEDDVIVGETLVEINTPSMHFLEEDEDHAIPTRREIRPQRYESMQQLKSIDEQSDDSVCEEEEILNSEDERELQRIREMEESYLLHNSAKTPKKTLQNNSASKEVDSNQKMPAELVMQQETEIEIIEEATTTDDTYANNCFDADIDPIPELIERVMEKFTAQPQTPPQFQTDFVEILRNSSLEQIEQIDAIITDELKPHSFMPDNSIRMTFNFEPNDILSPENIAKAFFDAIEATNLDFALNNGGEQQNNFSSCGEDSGENVDSKKSMDNSKTTTTESSDESTVICQQDNERTTDFGEEEVELERPETTNPSSMPANANDEADATHNYAESYYDTQYEYQITSKAPSCFNSDDYVFHANFIRPTPSTDRLRARPHPRKSMSFSNERMREIERHNQILLRKILTQKPTYMSKSAQHKVPNKTNSQTQVRLTTSAVNRKKQQRQIEMDNQVLQRKIEAIALRRRPLIS